MIKDFMEEVANDFTEQNKANNKEFLTGETNLSMTRDQLKEKLSKLENGQSYLGVLNIEYNILESQGVITGRNSKDGVIFEIPDWDSFISRVNAFHNICGPY